MINEINDEEEMECKASEYRNIMRNRIVSIICLISSILLSYILNNPIGNYIPIILITIIEWYKSYNKQNRSYYGLFRLLLYIILICLWIVFLLKFIIELIFYLINFNLIQLNLIEHLFPYILIFTSFTRNKQDMNLNDKKRYIIHLFYDIPSFLLVLLFKFLNNPLNSLYSKITDYCYLGCLPISSDVKQLNKLGIKHVINMCAEYKGPLKTYEKYGIKQYYFPTIDGTPPTLDTINKIIYILNNILKKKEKFFIHCKSGISRSATIVLCHLIINENYSIDNAFKLIKEKRSEVTNAIVDYKSVKQFLLKYKLKIN